MNIFKQKSFHVGGIIFLFLSVLGYFGVSFLSYAYSLFMVAAILASPINELLWGNEFIIFSIIITSIIGYIIGGFIGLIVGKVILLTKKLKKTYSTSHYLIIKIGFYILIGVIIYFFFVPNELITNFKCSGPGKSPRLEWPSIRFATESGTQCCFPLEERAQKLAFDENCKIQPIGGSYGICLPCGDGICDTRYESKCNCPEDCK